MLSSSSTYVLLLAATTCAVGWLVSWKVRVPFADRGTSIVSVVYPVRDTTTLLLPLIALIVNLPSRPVWTSSPPILMQPRYAISLMRGPMTRVEIQEARGAGREVTEVPGSESEVEETREVS